VKKAKGNEERKLRIVRNEETILEDLPVINSGVCKNPAYWKGDSPSLKFRLHKGLSKSVYKGLLIRHNRKCFRGTNYSDLVGKAKLQNAAFDGQEPCSQCHLPDHKPKHCPHYIPSKSDLKLRSPKQKALYDFITTTPTLKKPILSLPPLRLKKLLYKFTFRMNPNGG